MTDIAIYGVGGFGREVLTLIQDINSAEQVYNLVGFFDDGVTKGTVVNGFPVLGGADDLNGWTGDIAVAVAIGTPAVKKRIVERITNARVSFPVLVHPTVIIGDSERVRIGQGSIICAASILTTDIRIGQFVILNLSCTVGHDAVIGDFSAFMPSCNISGEVTVGQGVYCGTGVKIINRVSIEEHSVIGAGAVVVGNIPSHCTAVGVPAKVIKNNK